MLNDQNMIRDIQRASVDDFGENGDARPNVNSVSIFGQVNPFFFQVEK